MTNKELNTMLQVNTGAYLFCKQYGLNDKLENLEYMLNYYNKCNIKEEYQEFFNDTKAKSHNDFYRYIIRFYTIKG